MTSLEKLLADWLTMDSAPKDGTPILAWCSHKEDPYFLSNGNLTVYGGHAEGLSHVSDGPHVVQWGGGWDDRSYEDPYAGWMPDWWFQFGSSFEVAANPIRWTPIGDANLLNQTLKEITCKS